MRNKILLYLFIFSVLFTIFIYVNDKKILDSLEEDLAQQEQLIEELEAVRKLHDIRMGRLHKIFTKYLDDVEHRE